MMATTLEFLVSMDASVQLLLCFKFTAPRPGLRSLLVAALYLPYTALRYLQHASDVRVRNPYRRLTPAITERNTDPL
jgi:hypothetical protein